MFTGNSKTGQARTSSLMAVVGLAQGLYYFVTGLWPLLSFATYQSMTGIAATGGMAQMFGVSLVIMAIVIAMASIRQAVSLEILVLAVGSGAVIALAEFVLVAQRILPKVYLIDMVARIVLIGLWVSAWTIRRRNP